MALILDLNQKDRDAVVDEAAYRAWDWFPPTPEGILCHAVFVQLMKDLARPQMHEEALEDLMGCEDHWWLEGAGVKRPYVLNRLREWAFIGDGKDMPAELNPEVGTAPCSRCKQRLPYDMFHKAPSSPSGLHPYCKPCASKINKERRE